MNKDVKQFIQRVRRAGIIVNPIGNGHYRMTYEGSFVGTLPATPGDKRWRKNVLADMRKFGVDLLQLEGVKVTKKDAGGQSPPPLPDIGKVQQMANIDTVGGARKNDLIQIAQKLAADISSHFNLQVRKGRTTAHGFAPRLHEVAYAYHKATGADVPHLNYAKVYDPTDMNEMSRLVAVKVSDIASKSLAREKVTITNITEKQIEFAREAWAWFESNDYSFPDLDEPTIEAIMAEVDEVMLNTEPVAVNGHSEDLAVAVRAIFLMGQSHYPDLDEIERIGMRLIDNALR